MSRMFSKQRISQLVRRYFFSLILFGLGLPLSLHLGWSLPGPATAPVQTTAATTPTGLSRQTATTTRTPFQPLPTRTNTLVPSRTPTATATATKTPTQKLKATRTLVPLPRSADVGPISGHPMISNLDCEARSAVDWAAFFGVSMDEPTFLSQLPSSDNPEKGFVGHYWDIAGGIPPNPYGVHAGPIARLLRAYGLKAYAGKGHDFRVLQKEIAAGRPVIVWVVGSVMPGTPVSYTASDGETTTVASMEHTVILTGYDENSVKILDGWLVYTRTLQQFLDSWSVLGNMAVTAREY